MPKILVVDDEPHILELTKLYLERDGFQVETVGTGKNALAKIANKPDLVILDLMLPDIDGFEVCRQIRAKGNTPVLMLTARKDDVDKIVGLEMGADDYCTKPFNPRELVARVKAILRRSQGGGGTPGSIIEMGKLRIDLTRHEVTVADQPVKLRTKELALLATLAQSPGVVFSREKLLELVWGYDYYGETRTVDVHVNHLREKLAGSDVVIETLRGTGYKMTVSEAVK